METIECPICFRTYKTTPKQCSCGYRGLKSTNLFAEPTDAYRKKELFEIYKYTKKVYYGQIPDPSRAFYYTDMTDHVLVTDAPQGRGLSVVDADAVEEIRGRFVRADEGLLAFQSSVASLILNVDEVDPGLLDESCLRMLFLGKRVQGFGGSGLMYQALRYLFVDSENPYLTAENHVLYDKQMTELICYPTRKPEEEFTLPEGVRRILPRAFGYGANHLRLIRIPRSFRNHDVIRAFFAPHTEVEFY